MERSRIRSRAGRRGFTLVELLAAIVIIGLLTALATPSFIAMMRDRRVARAAVILADTYREARTRAMARSNAVLVRWTATGDGKGTLETRETLVQPLTLGPSRGCNTANWAAVSTDTREVYNFNFAGSTYELAEIQLVTEGAADVGFGEMCFSPEGRTWIRYANGPFTQLTGVPRYSVVNKKSGFKREVFLPPNGVARVGL